jgi:hypothetical protein
MMVLVPEIGSQHLLNTSLEVTMQVSVGLLNEFVCVDDANPLERILMLHRKRVRSIMQQ